MDNISTAEAATHGALVALAELNISPDEFLKVAKNVDRLYSRSDRSPVMRKAAAIVADLLESSPSTKGRFANNFMREMSKSAEWHECFDDYLRDAYTPIMEKRARGGAEAGVIANILQDVPGGIFTIGGISGGLGGAVAHYLGKQVDEDHVDIEKERAKQNEYLRLINEIDRKITARALRTE